MCESSIFLPLFIQLYIAKVLVGSGSRSGENFPDPTGFATLPMLVTEMYRLIDCWWARARVQGGGGALHAVP